VTNKLILLTSEIYKELVSYLVDNTVQRKDLPFREIKKLERWIKSYLEIENIYHTDLSKVSMNDRVKFIIDTIIK